MSPRLARVSPAIIIDSWTRVARRVQASSCTDMWAWQPGWDQAEIDHMQREGTHWIMQDKRSEPGVVWLVVKRKTS